MVKFISFKWKSKNFNRIITVDLERKYAQFDDTGESDDESYVDSDQSSSTASSFASLKYVCGWFLRFKLLNYKKNYISFINLFVKLLILISLKKKKIIYLFSDFLMYYIWKVYKILL